MSTNYPTSLDTSPTRTDGDVIYASHVQNAQDAIVALETKVGVNSSAVATSLDYLVKNTSSSNPGHKHTFSSLSDFNVSSPVTGDQFQYNGSSWVNTPNATTFGDGSDGNITISSPTTLTRDMYYNNLTVSSTLTTNGFLIFVKNKIDGAGTIKYPDPNNGGNASGQTGGTAAAAFTTGRIQNIAGAAGGNGGNSGGTNAGAAGSNGAGAVTPGVSGVAGVAGGSGGLSGAGGGAGTAGTATAPIPRIGTVSFNTVMGLNIALDAVITAYKGSAGTGGSGGGGGSGGASSGAGGGGGAGGASGGVVIICAKEWAGTVTIQAIGGNGGNGGNAGATNAGNGSGGSAGSGGTSVVVYLTKSWTGSYNLAAGSVGNKGTGGQGGANGNAGNTGSSYEILVTTLL
jgi:hypothetical protein